MQFSFRPLLISSCIFPEDEKSETICRSIVETLKEKTSLLDQWIVVHESMFGTNHDIPSAEAIHLSKLWDGIITTDTCNSARLLSSQTCWKNKTDAKTAFKKSNSRAAKLEAVKDQIRI